MLEFYFCEMGSGVGDINRVNLSRWIIIIFSININWIIWLK